MTKLNLELCNLFNPGLIYDFEPEGKVHGDQNEDSYLDLENYVLQKVDIYEALVYAQSTIIPQINQGWHKITSMQVTQWITAIHGIVSKTLLGDIPEFIGRYPDIATIVTRFHHGAELREHVCLLLENKTLENYQLLFNNVCEEFKIMERDQFQQFLDLCLRLANDESIEIDPSLASNLPYRSFHRMREVCYSDDYLTAEERSLIAKFVIVCLPADKLPAAMDVFSKSVIDVMLHCDELDEMARYKAFAEIFYQLTSIHPFVNANGRTATVFLNTLLVSLKLPSILLRHPGDRENKSSLYSQAIDEIDVSREKLAQLIASRISSPAYHSEMSQNTLFLQYEVYTLFKSVHNSFGLMCVQKLFKKIINDIDPAIDMEQLQEENGDLKVQLQYATLMFADRNNFFGKSSEFAQASDIKAFVIVKLKQFTGEDWKISQKSGKMIAWMLFTSIERQQACLTLLRNYFAGTECIIKEGRPQGKTDSWMIQIENINLDKLSQVATSLEPVVFMP